jgi:hypothetical protein
MKKMRKEALKASRKRLSKGMWTVTKLMVFPFHRSNAAAGALVEGRTLL